MKKVWSKSNNNIYLLRRARKLRWQQRKKHGKNNWTHIASLWNDDYDM